MFTDLRYACRSLLRQPGYALVALATLAIGIGGTVAMFSACYAVLLAPLPFPNAREIVVPVSVNPGRGIEDGSIPYADYEDWAKQRDIFAHVAAWRPIAVDVAGTEAPERVETGQVGVDYFNVLGVTPAMGRAFRPEDHAASAPRVAIVSYRFWQRALGGAPDAVGREIRIAGNPVPIVGILGRNAIWPAEQDLWIPLKPTLFAREDLSRRDNMIFLAIARLQPGVSLEAGRARVREIAARVAADDPQARKGWSTNLVPLRESVVAREMHDALLVLLSAVGVLLLIVCVNLANLLLARGTSRARELAVRTALGASRARLAAQLLAESAVVAAIGGALGLGVAAGLMRVLVRLAPAGVPFVTEMSLNLPALAAAAAVTLGAVLLFGILPAVAGAGRPPVDALKDGGAGTGAAVRTMRLRDALVVVEMALALVLLVSAGLLVRSFAQIVGRNAGVDVDRVVAARLSLPGSRYANAADRIRFYETLTRELAALPGATAAAATSFLPAGGGGFGLGRVFLIEGQPEPPASADFGAQWTVVTPDYFRTLGNPLVAGRTFTDRDAEGSTPVIVINETLAKKMFPNGGALGRRIRSWRDENLLREIVGIVADVRYGGLAEAKDSGLVYVPHRQNAWSGLTVAVRASGDPAMLANGLRETVKRLDPNLGVGQLGTLSDFARASVARERFSAALLAGFAAVAVLLAAVGIYGVMAYVVARRRRELGVRAALGATPRELFTLVARRGLALTAAGSAIGLLLSVAAARAISGLLFGVGGGDPVTFAAALIVLPAVSMLACAIPARRAARVDPMATLRSE